MEDKEFLKLLEEKKELVFAWVREQHRRDKEKNKKTRCPTCGHSAYMERTLNKSHIDALEYFVQYSKESNKVEIPTTEIITEKIKDGELPNSIYSTYANLAYFGFLIPSGGSREDGNPKSGMYWLSDTAEPFLRGEISVPKKIATSRNSILFRSTETGFVGDFYKNFHYETHVLTPGEYPAEDIFQYVQNLQ